MENTQNEKMRSKGCEKKWSGTDFKLGHVERHWLDRMCQMPANNKADTKGTGRANESTTMFYDDALLIALHRLLGSLVRYHADLVH